MTDYGDVRKAFKMSIMDLSPDEIPDSIYEKLDIKEKLSQIDSFYASFLANTIQLGWIREWEEMHPEETAQKLRYYHMYANIVVSFDDEHKMSDEDRPSAVAKHVANRLIEMEEPDLSWEGIKNHILKGMLYQTEQMAKFLAERKTHVPLEIQNYNKENGGDIPSISGEREI